MSAVDFLGAVKTASSAGLRSATSSSPAQAQRAGVACSLVDTLQPIRKNYPKCHLFLVVPDLDVELKNVQAAMKRRYTQMVQQQSRAMGAVRAPSQSQIDQAIMQVRDALGCHVQLPRKDDASTFLTILTYQLMRSHGMSVPLLLQDSGGGRKGYTSDHVWESQLTTVCGISRRAAQAIARVFPCMAALFEEYSSIQSEDARAHLLTARCTARMVNRPASRRVYRTLFATDPGEKL